MTDREKLIDLMTQAKKEDPEDRPFSEFLADFMFANGVTVQKWNPVSEPPEVWRDENGDMVNYFVNTQYYGVDIACYMAPAKCWLSMGFLSTSHTGCRCRSRQRRMQNEKIASLL